jgi:hypothetical protein
MSWKTVPICEKCWREEEPDRQPVQVIGADEEVCYKCGEKTTAGIYVRRFGVGGES